jgi:hypothetical protein
VASTSFYLSSISFALAHILPNKFYLLYLKGISCVLSKKTIFFVNSNFVA